MTLAATRDRIAARWREVADAGAGHGRRHPVAAVAAAGVVIVVAVLTRPLAATLPLETAARWGWSADLVRRGDWWRLVTALPLTRDPFMLASMVLSLLVAVGVLERLAGWRRAAVTVTGGAIAGYLGVTAIVLVLRGLGLAAAGSWAQTLDYGASAGVAACAGAVAGLLHERVVTVALATVVAGGLVLHHQIADWEHAFAFVATGTLTRLRTTT